MSTPWQFGRIISNVGPLKALATSPAHFPASETSPTGRSTTITEIAGRSSCRLHPVLPGGCFASKNTTGYSGSPPSARLKYVAVDFRCIAANAVRLSTVQGAGSVATGVSLHAASEGARLSIADVDSAKAKALADKVDGQVVAPDDVLFLEADVVSPNALGAILNDDTIPRLKTPIVAGGANNQLATPEDGERLKERGILYAPDYVINAGGIINVCTEYLGDGDAGLVRERIEGIPVRLEQIWTESAETGRDPAAVADAMAQRLIGRG